MPWMRDIARRIHGPVTFNFSQTDIAPDLWMEVLAELDACRADGTNVWGQVAGRPIGVLMSWESSAHPFMGHPSIVALSGLSDSERLATLRDPAFRQRVIDEEPVGLSRFQTSLATSFDKMFPFVAETDYEPASQDSLAARAQRLGTTAVALAYDTMVDFEGRGL